MNQIKGLFFYRYKNTGTSFYAEMLADIIGVQKEFISEPLPYIDPPFIVINKPPDQPPELGWIDFFIANKGKYIYIEWDMHSSRMFEFNDLICENAHRVFCTSLERAEAIGGSYLQLWGANYRNSKNNLISQSKEFTIGLDYLNMNSDVERIVDICRNWNIQTFQKKGFSPISPNSPVDIAWQNWIDKMKTIDIMIDHPKDGPFFKSNIKMLTALSFNQIPVFPKRVHANAIFNMDTLYEEIQEIPLIIHRILRDSEFRNQQIEKIRQVNQKYQWQRLKNSFSDNILSALKEI